MPSVELIRAVMLLHFTATVGVEGTARVLPYVKYVAYTTR